MNKDFSKLCTPAKLYFAIAVVASLIALFNKVSLIAVFMKLVFAFIWTYILSWLCIHGYKSLSWFLVLLPYVFILLAVVGIMHLSSSQSSILNTLKLQGAFGKENFTNKHKASMGTKMPMPVMMKK